MPTQPIVLCPIVPLFHCPFVLLTIVLLSHCSIVPLFIATYLCISTALNICTQQSLNLISNTPTR